MPPLFPLSVLHLKGLDAKVCKGKHFRIPFYYFHLFTCIKYMFYIVTNFSDYFTPFLFFIHISIHTYIMKVVLWAISDWFSIRKLHSHKPTASSYLTNARIHSHFFTDHQLVLVLCSCCCVFFFFLVLDTRINQF